MCEISTVLKLQKTEMTTDEMVAFIFVRFTCRVGFEVKLYNYIANSSKGIAIPPEIFFEAVLRGANLGMTSAR